MLQNTEVNNKALETHVAVAIANAVPFQRRVRQKRHEMDLTQHCRRHGKASESKVEAVGW